jgi:hypothetical protein
MGRLTLAASGIQEEQLGRDLPLEQVVLYEGQVALAEATMLTIIEKQR